MFFAEYEKIKNCFLQFWGHIINCMTSNLQRDRPYLKRFGASFDILILVSIQFEVALLNKELFI